MNIFIIVLYIIGAVVFSAVVAVISGVLLSILLYSTMTTIRLIKGYRLFGECLFKPLNDKSKCTEQHAESKGYAQYIKYFINDYFRLFWRHNKITDAIFYCLKKYAYTERRNKCNQDVGYFFPVQSNEKSLDGIHADNLPEGKSHVNQKRTIPHCTKTCFVTSRIVPFLYHNVTTSLQA